MNYIYDIYLNLNKELYDPFDWNSNDRLTHIKKIPIFVVLEDDLKKIIYNIVKVHDDFLNDIYNKAECLNIPDKIKYCAIFSDLDNVVAVEFNDEGISIKKSFASIEEELEILESIYRFKRSNIKFDILKEEKNLFKTRKQLTEDNFINKELENMEKDKLDYVYFECFGYHEKNKSIILKNLKKLSKNSKVYKNLYDILKLTSTTKNKML